MSTLFRRSSSDPPALFPTYLLPSLSFRRKSTQRKVRHDSSDSTASTSTAASDNTAFSSTTQSSTSTAATSASITFSADSPSSNPFSRSPTPAPLPSLHTSTVPLSAPTDKFLHGHTSHIQCSKCATDLALTSQIISKGFTGRHGRAYLVSGHPSSKYASTKRTLGTGGALPNTFLAKPVARSLVTGQHIVCDVSCAICGTVIGWKYIEASEESQKYKVGKFILETKRVRVSTRWDNEEGAAFGTGYHYYEETEGDADGAGDELEFDSQDEDECEDLLLGCGHPDWPVEDGSGSLSATGGRLRRSMCPLRIGEARRAWEDDLGRTDLGKLGGGNLHSTMILQYCMDGEYRACL